MNSSCPVSQHDYAALSMLTQAADAMNPMSNHSQPQPQSQRQSSERSGRIQGTHVPLHVQFSTREADHKPESPLPMLSSRTMETMSAFNGNGGYGRGYFNTQHQQLGANGYVNGNGMQILDAESYDDGRGAARDRMDGQERRRAQREVVMPFGITDGPRLGKEKVVDVVETGGAKKKRKTKHKPAVDVQRDSQEEDEEEEEARKKARGRPRVDTKDETPAERRRTQIRLAQRAYRNRKETTISSLEKKVQDLRGTNEEMSNIFINLYDFVVSQGILGRDPELAHQFQSATERFVVLAKSAGNDDSNAEEIGSDKNQKQDSAEPGSDRKSKGRKISPKPVPTEQIITPPISEPASNPWGGYTLTKETSPVHEADLPSSLQDRSNIQVISRPTTENACFPLESMDSDPMSQHAVSDRRDIQGISKSIEDNTSFPSDLMDLQQYRAQIPTMDSYSQMFMSTLFPPPPTSFAFSEISFARRLHRNSTEGAMKLACMPNPPAGLYQRVFGITSMYQSKDAIIRRIGAVLAKSSKETLQEWKAPFLHLGGSGTFYPMPESERNSDSMPKLQSGYSVGPFTAEISQIQDLVDDDMTIDLPAFRSDFFDPNDVEGYLRSRGIEIPSSADFVSVEIDLNSFGEIPSRRNSSTTGTRSPRTPHSFVDNMLLHSSNTSDPVEMEYSNYNFNANAVPNTSNSNLSSEFDPLTGYQVSPASHSSYSSKSVVTINVQTLVEELSRRGVCLGRSPGYRPNDVNIALMAAIKAGAGFSS